MPPCCPFHAQSRDPMGSPSSPGQSQDGNPTLTPGAICPWFSQERLGVGSHWPPTLLSASPLGHQGPQRPTGLHLQVEGGWFLWQFWGPNTNPGTWWAHRGLHSWLFCLPAGLGQIYLSVPLSSSVGGFISVPMSRGLWCFQGTWQAQGPSCCKGLIRMRASTGAGQPAAPRPGAGLTLSTPQAGGPHAAAHT